VGPEFSVHHLLGKMVLMNIIGSSAYAQVADLNNSGASNEDAFRSEIKGHCRPEVK
jgi:hypothetical protein